MGGDQVEAGVASSSSRSGLQSSQVPLPPVLWRPWVVRVGVHPEEASAQRPGGQREACVWQEGSSAAQPFSVRPSGVEK